MARMNMIQALNSAMDIMMTRDPTSSCSGEDVGYFGGVFRGTDGLQRKYGEHRVLDTPIAEGGIVGAAIGMGVNGLRPVAEIQFADYIYPACDQIFSELARIRYRSGGEFWAPVTIRTPCGGGIRGGQTHSQSPGGDLHARVRHQGRDAVEPVRREGPADRCDRGRRPGGVLRAEAALQRAVRRRSQQARRAVERRIRKARCPTATTRCRSARPRSCARARTSRS